MTSDAPDSDLGAAVIAWPAIAEQQLLQRLAMTIDELAAHVLTVTELFAGREYDASQYERAIGYPWARPESSYFLTGEDVQPLAAMDAARHDAIRRRFAAAAGRGERFPLLAYGANGAPRALAAKFAHFGGDDRDVLALAGVLEDFDVGAAAHPTAYGAMPATLLPSPGTRMRCAVLWVSAAQFVQLTWSEISYCLGRLDGVRFVADDEGDELDSVLAFVSRWGAFCPDGGTPVALAAVPAENRTAPAMSQAQLLDAAARIALGPEASSEHLVRELFSDLRAFVAHRAAPIRQASARFSCDRWVTFPGGSEP